MHGGGHGAGGKVAVELLGAQLQADLRPPLEVHRPLVTLGRESGLRQDRDRHRRLLRHALTAPP